MALNVKIVNFLISNWREGGFYKVFGDRPTKWSYCKNNIIKIVMLWDAPQLIKLI
jgi:hypothetical protein